MTSPRIITGLTLTAAAAALTLGFAAPASAAGSLSANKTTGLNKAGESITVKGSGFEAGKSLMLINCDLSTQRGEGCDMGGTVSVTTDAAGAFSSAFTAKGSYGTTDCDKVSCGVVVYDMSTHSLPARLKLSFGAAPTSSKPATSKPATSKPATQKPSEKPATAAPTKSSDKPTAAAAKPSASASTPAKSELANTGSSNSTLPLVAGGAALVLVGAGATFAVRRRGGSNHAA